MDVVRFIDFINENMPKSRFYSGFFNIWGDFGQIETNIDYIKKTEKNSVTYYANDKGLDLTATFIQDKEVYIRKDVIKNVSGKDIVLNGILSRFTLSGGDYEVYNENSVWQNESQGAWQHLVSTVKSETLGIRSCDGSTPIMAIKDNSSNKKMVFHLVPNCRWQMEMAVKPMLFAELKMSTFECGFNSQGLSMVVKNGESIELPEVIFYEYENDLDFDGYKLHNYFNEKYPRKNMPVMFNTWLYQFDGFNIDDVIKSIDTAHELGIEVFTIDAGWFAKVNDWGNKVGDWEESTESATKGRLEEVSNKLKSYGMTFGLWFEPERAESESNAQKNHPDYYFDNIFTNFADCGAREFVFDKVCKAIDKYNIGFMKFDFNSSTPYSKENDAFYQYFKGQKLFIDNIMKKYPNMIISNCASGGYRLALNNAKNFNSFWLSDNQSPIKGVELIKNYVKRLPPQVIERWAVLKFTDGIPTLGIDGFSDKVKVPVYTNNATWTEYCTVSDEYLMGFLFGGPFGFTCDINSFTEEFKNKIKEFIKYYKENREYFKSVNARILIDSDNITAIEYADKDFNKISIKIFIKKPNIGFINISPVLDKNAKYLFNGKKYNSQELLNGIYLDYIIGSNICKSIDLVKC